MLSNSLSPASDRAVFYWVGLFGLAGRLTKSYEKIVQLSLMFAERECVGGLPGFAPCVERNKRVRRQQSMH